MTQDSRWASCFFECDLYEDVTKGDGSYVDLPAKYSKLMNIQEKTIKYGEFDVLERIQTRQEKST